MTFVATVYREFFSEPNSSPYEVSGGFISIFPSASMHTGRLSACREFCGVHSWQNGTRCRDGVKVLWCH